jgi:hypothetical protein
MIKSMTKLKYYVKPIIINLLILLTMSVTMVSCQDSDDILPIPEPIPEPTEESHQPSIVSVSFSAELNPNQLIEDAQCEIIGDSIVECWIWNTIGDKYLIPEIEYKGDAVYVDSLQITSGKTKLDFNKPLVLTVVSDSLRKDYSVYVYSFTGLPVLQIETAGRAKIISKDEYLRASFKLVENIRTHSSFGVILDSVNIKGRGNSSWDIMPKKSYRLKFDNKISLFDDPKDKSWVLLANYSDKTCLRNHTAFYMGSISKLDYTPRFHFVELILNGMYMGNYQLGEKVKIGKDRVNAGKDGFLLEIDAKATPDEVTFRTPHLEYPVNIKDPDVAVDDEDYNYAKDFVMMAENALYSENFTDKDEGWQKYIDMESFVDWYLINEIAKNNDAAFYSSCYMSLRRGGKLKMGPLWDFDIAFGNINYNDNFNTSGFWVKRASWYEQLFKDPAFVKRVKERFNYFYSRKDDIMREINKNANYLRYSVEEDNNIWARYINIHGQTMLFVAAI